MAGHQGSTSAHPPCGALEGDGRHHVDAGAAQVTSPICASRGAIITPLALESTSSSGAPWGAVSIGVR
eukprot:4587523-Pyramimonas_sp.AAC.1